MSYAAASMQKQMLLSVQRERMLGSSLYLSGREVSTGNYISNGSYVQNDDCCSMCKRMIINAGIETVYIRDDEDHYRVVQVQNWIDEDESLDGTFGY